MWNGKKKAVTFSYDDGVTQDCRLVEMMNTYGVKGTCCRCRYWGVDPNAISASLWTTVLELIVKAAEAAEPRECYHPANSKKG